MFEARQLSKLIREKKKRALRPDLDDAGPESVSPEDAWQAKMDADVNETLGEPDHEPASEAEMGGDGTSQDKMSLKRAMSIVAKYFSSMKIGK